MDDEITLVEKDLRHAIASCASYISAYKKRLNLYSEYYNLKTVKEIITRFFATYEKSFNPTPNANNNSIIIGALGYMSSLNEKANLACIEHGENLNVFYEELEAELIAAIILLKNGSNPFTLEFIEKCKGY